MAWRLSTVAVWPRLRRVWRVFASFCYVLFTFFGVSVLLRVFYSFIVFFIILSFFLLLRAKRSVVIT